MHPWRGQYLVQFIKEHKFLFATYLTMLFVPFVAFVVCLSSANSIMRQDALQYQNSILQHEQSICDNMVHNTKIAINTVALETNVKLLQEEENFSPEDMFRIKKLRDSMNDIKGNYSYIDSLGIYFRKNDSFVTDVKRYATPLHSTYLEQYNLTLDEFLSYTDTASGYAIIEGENETYILLYQSLFDYSLKKMSAVAYGIIPWSELQTQLTYCEQAQGSEFFLLNQDNTLLASPDIYNSFDTPLDYNTIHTELQENNKNIFFFENKGSLISGLASDELDIYYGSYLVKSDFYHAVNILLFKYVGALILTVLIGIGLALYFTKKNSAPIAHLLSMLEDSKKRNSSIALPANYVKLEQALTNMLKDNRRLSHKVSLQEEKISETTLSGFLKGIYPNEDWILEYHDNHPILQKIDDYRIVLFCFSNIETSKFIREQNESLESYSLLFFSLKNIIDEAFLKNNDASANGVSIVSDSMVICIVPAYNEPQEKDTIIESAENCIQFFHDVFQLDSCITISDAHSLWTELPDAYEEAYATSSHASFWEHNSSVNFYHAETADASSDISNLLQLKKKLANSLIANNYDTAQTLMNEIIDQYFPHDIHHFAYNQCQSHALISMLLDKLRDIGMEDSRREYYSSRLLNARTIIELKKEISTVFDELFAHQNESNSDDSWVKSVQQYIQANSSNPELSVSYIADHFSVSAAHLGTRFRKLTGNGVLDYIHIMRLAKCKELLAQGLTIRDCADMTGYTDIKTLQRAFKRYEGITPGQYKESAEKKAKTEGAL